MCSWEQPPNYYLSILKRELSVNMIRLPFSGSYIQKGAFHAMDGMMVTASTLNMSVLLDWHRNTDSHQSASPLTDYSFDEWVQLWRVVIDRYIDNPVVTGLGLYNEFQSTNGTYVFDTQFQLVETLESFYPNRFVYYMGCAEWGTDCSRIVDYLDHPLFSRLMIESHKYPFNHGAWDESTWDETIPSQVPSHQWFIGEIGWDQETGWETNFLGYLNNRNINKLCFWTISNSRDTGGLWKDDCTTPEFKKSEDLKRYWQKGDASPISGLHGVTPP